MSIEQKVFFYQHFIIFASFFCILSYLRNFYLAMLSNLFPQFSNQPHIFYLEPTLAIRKSQRTIQTEEGSWASGSQALRLTGPGGQEEGRKREEELEHNRRERGGKKMGE